jgi:hypothetical protein
MSQAASVEARGFSTDWQPASPHEGELARWESHDGRHIAVCVAGAGLSVRVSWSDDVSRFPTLHEAMLAARSLQIRGGPCTGAGLLGRP